MKQSHAAGRKTENTLGLLGTHLDRQLERLTQALGQCLDQADAVPREDDPHGHHRAGEIEHAVTIAKTSAKLIASLAKVSREFQHTITVNRVGEEKRDAPGPRGGFTHPTLGFVPHIRRTRVRAPEPDPSELLTPEELEAMSDEEVIASMDAGRGYPPRNSQGSND